MDSYKINFTIDETYLDSTGRVRPGALLYFAQEAAVAHCQIIGANATGDLFWAVIRHKTEITRLPRLGQTITVETWPMPTTRTAFPRVAFAYDEAGNELFHIISLWVLMDKNTRAMVLPAKSGVDVPGLVKNCEPTTPGSILPKELTSAGIRPVTTEDLDENLHMNNTRYLDWAWDLLPGQWLNKTPRVFTVCYLNEARLDQEIHLSWGQTAPDTLQIEGRRQTGEKQERIFAVSVNF